MTTPFNIIWIDDQYDEQESFWDQAERHGFEITAFKTSVEGINYLRENLHDIDALILDAKVFTNSTNDLPSERGLTASLREIAKLSGQHGGKEIPHVIFTGQADLSDDDLFREKMDGVPVFSKSAPDNKPLFECLKSLIEQTTSATLRNRYFEVYAACHSISPEGVCWRMLYPILSSFISGNTFLSDPYNDVRKVVELAFRFLHKKAVIHERLIENGLINLQGCSLFLAGMEARLSRESVAVKAKSPIAPRILANQLKLLLEICQAGSHTDDPFDQQSTKANISEIERWNPRHNLLESATLMAMDFIVWAQAYVDENPDPKKNMQIWETNSARESAASTVKAGVTVEGEILSITRGGHAFVKTDHLQETNRMNTFIRNTLRGNDELVKGCRVRVTISDEITDKGAVVATSYACI
jgi:hypothetical protein